jgi:hypothetical protein
MSAVDKNSFASPAFQPITLKVPKAKNKAEEAVKVITLASDVALEATGFVSGIQEVSRLAQLVIDGLFSIAPATAKQILVSPKIINDAKKIVQKDAKLVERASSTADLVVRGTDVAKFVSNVLKYLNKFKLFSKRVAKSFAFISPIALCTGVVFTGPKLVGALKKFVQTKRTAIDRAENFVDILGRTGKIIKAVSATMKLVSICQVVSSGILRAIPILGIAGTVIIKIPQALFTIAKDGNRLRQTLFTTKRLKMEKNSLVGRCKVLQNASTQIVENGIDKLNLSSDAALVLQTKINNVRALLFDDKGTFTDNEQAERSITELEKALSILQGRVKVILAYDSIELVNRIVLVAASVLCYSPLLPLGLGLALASSLASLVTYLALKLFVKTNPFDAQNKSAAASFAERVSKKAASMMKSLKSGQEKQSRAFPIN